MLRSLATGRPNKLIAHELAICETTVKVHLRHIFRKLGTTNRTHAALLAREMLEGDAKAEPASDGGLVPSLVLLVVHRHPDPAQHQLVGFQAVDAGEVRHAGILDAVLAVDEPGAGAAGGQRRAEAGVAQQVPEQPVDRLAQAPRGRLGRRPAPWRPCAARSRGSPRPGRRRWSPPGRPAKTVK